MITGYNGYTKFAPLDVVYHLLRLLEEFGCSRLVIDRDKNKITQDLFHGIYDYHIYFQS